MLSIIICSRFTTISSSLRKNIENTIGVEYELIVIDNSQNDFSLFSAYNKGVKLSKYAVLCFMHDDLFIDTNDWGLLAIQKFKDEQVGAVGLAGSPYFSILPGAWWSGGYITLHLSGSKDISYAKPIDNALPVVVLDGFWFCIKKSLFNSISFDEKYYSGFHFYEIDICLQINQLGYKLYSLFNIDIQHSSGILNAKWLENALLLQKKWLNDLPVSVVELSYAQELRIEYAVLEEYLSAMRTNGASNIKITQFAVNQILKHRLKRFKLIFPPIFLLYAIRYLGKKLRLR